MKLSKTASGKTSLNITKAEWQTIGKQAGWDKVAAQEEDIRYWLRDTPAVAIWLRKSDFEDLPGIQQLRQDQVTPTATKVVKAKEIAMQAAVERWSVVLNELESKYGIMITPNTLLEPDFGMDRINWDALVSPEPEVEL